MKPYREAGIARMLVIAAGLVVLAGPAQAAKQCQDDVDELRHDIKHNEDTYRKDAREEALEHLRKAELHRINPVECWDEVARARAALVSGRKVGDAGGDKKDKKDK